MSIVMDLLYLLLWVVVCLITVSLWDYKFVQKFHFCRHETKLGSEQSLLYVLCSPLTTSCGWGKPNFDHFAGDPQTHLTLGSQSSLDTGMQFCFFSTRETYLIILHYHPQTRAFQCFPCNHDLTFSFNRRWIIDTSCFPSFFCP